MPNSQPIAVFYRPELVAEAQSFSPSAGKPRPVVDDWLAAGLPVVLQSFVPATAPDLALAHDPAYVQGVLACSLPNGFGNHLPGVARALPHTVGAMIAAARAALTRGVACAPVSGFHHAHYDFGGGFCTFNGLMVAALRLLADDQVGRVLVLDCDMHHGDGTAQIIEKLRVGDVITQRSFGEGFHRPSQSRAYLATLEGVVEHLRDFDLVLYQPGADVHVEDPLGGVLTTREMRERDEMVFSAGRAQRVPIAWNLAGGYQEPLSKLLALHRQTMEVCCGIYSGLRATPLTQSASRLPHHGYSIR